MGTYDKSCTYLNYKSGNAGISTFMRRLLSGYAVYYNKINFKINEYGVTLAETARQLGISTSAIAQILKRN